MVYSDETLAESKKHRQEVCWNWVCCESDSVSGALLMIRKAVEDQPLAETGKK